jgi:hypothetical protein
MAGEFFKRIGQEIGAEFGRLSIQGRGEAANAIFSGSAYLPYGAGQLPPKMQQENANEGVQTSQEGPEKQLEIEHER